MQMKRWMSAALCGATLLCCGCQMTPAESFVQQKDQERMLEAAAATGQFTQAADEPDRCVWQGENKSGNVKVRINAPVERLGQSMPIARVYPGHFAPDDLVAAAGCLFPQGDALQYSTFGAPLTRSDIEAMIVRYRSYIAAGTAEENTLMTAEELLAEISRLQEEYQAAPATNEAFTAHPFTGELEPAPDTGGPSLYAVTLRGDGNSQFNAMTAQGTGEDAYANLSYDASTDTSGFPTVRALTLDEDADETGLSTAQAQALSAAFFSAAGAADVQPLTAELVCSEADGSYAYKYILGRSIAGTPAAQTFYVQNDVYSDEVEDAFQPWPQEQIEVVVGKDSILHVGWLCKTDPGEILNENAEVMPFTEAQAVFERSIFAVYPGTNLRDGQEISIDVNRICLGLLRIRETGSDLAGLYVPAWIWYGTVEDPSDEWYISSMEYEGVYQGERIVLALNAVDGSIIDVARGY